MAIPAARPSREAVGVVGVRGKASPGEVIAGEAVPGKAVPPGRAHHGLGEGQSLPPLEVIPSQATGCGAVAVRGTVAAAAP